MRPNPVIATDTAMGGLPREREGTPTAYAVARVGRPPRGAPGARRGPGPPSARDARPRRDLGGRGLHGARRPPRRAPVRRGPRPRGPRLAWARRSGRGPRLRRG